VSDRLPVAAYERAERMLAHHRPRLALRTSVTPQWIGDGARFWYAVETDRGREFVLADPERGTRAPAFDHERLAAALAAASGNAVEPYGLSFSSIELVEDRVAFDAFGACWTFEPDSGRCERVAGRRPRSPLEVPSPDGRWVAFRRGEDVWVRAVATGEERALTTDGTAERGYAAGPDPLAYGQLMRRHGFAELPPALLWSPDSRRILTHRLDQRGVEPLHLVEAAPPDGGRPRLHVYRYAMPGEPLPCGEWVVLDVATGAIVEAVAEPFPVLLLSPIVARAAWWSADAATAYFLEQPHDLRTLRLRALDPRDGAVRTLIEERGETRVEAAQEWRQPPMAHVLAGGREALWYSQRDGWGHLYLYDLASGRMRRQLTRGSFAVQRILHVDEDERVAYVQVSGLVGADPYRRSLVRVALDGAEPVRLTGDELDHALAAPPNGRWFVDSASTVDTPPVTTVRGRDGAVLLELERADVSRLRTAGWTPPERVRTLAADGVTPIYGVLYKPFGFDPSQRYPVVDHPYPGPHVTRVLPSFDQGALGCDAEALAALGFAVLAVDGRGTPGRDKAFHDHAYRNLGSGGALEDHVAALRQLAAARPWLDLDRVGVCGYSAGGFAAVRAMLAFPELYKVGVAEAGCHDYRRYNAGWAQTYDGPFDPDAGARLSNTELADRLSGHLLLVHGELDDNVTPYLTLRLADRLIAANKDFDLLIVPGVEHTFAGREAYVIRRRWDYLVRHLMGRRPPAYRIADVPPPAPEALLEPLVGPVT
jgi:dipeptidyl-peptidase 4